MSGKSQCENNEKNRKKGKERLSFEKWIYMGSLGKGYNYHSDIKKKKKKKEGTCTYLAINDYFS